MKIVVFAEQYRNGGWDVWEYQCDPIEAKALLDSAAARANARELDPKPVLDDYLESARSLFDIARGTPGFPRNGDTRVYCVCVDKIVIGVYEKIRQYSQRLEPEQFAAAPARARSPEPARSLSNPGLLIRPAHSS